MENAYDRILTCPYNPAHVMLRGRNQTHLMKCREQYINQKGVSVDYVACSFNNTHILPSQEIEIHELECPSRTTADEFFVTEERVLEAAPNHSLAITTPQCEEDWDNEVTERPVLEMVQERAKTKKVLLNLHGKPPAERKKHRLEEKLRHRELNDKPENH